jgi:hypothetical protein
MPSWGGALSRPQVAWQTLAPVRRAELMGRAVWLRSGLRRCGALPVYVLRLEC